MVEAVLMVVMEMMVVGRVMAVIMVRMPVQVKQ